MWFRFTYYPPCTKPSAVGNLCCGHTDMRKSINGLMTLVQHGFSLAPYAEALFVFCNGTRDRLKILEWDGDGYWLYFKRLERGHFRWPSSDGESTITLSGEELSCLIDGARLEKKLRRSDIFEPKIS